MFGDRLSPKSQYRLNIAILNFHPPMAGEYARSKLNLAKDLGLLE